MNNSINVSFTPFLKDIGLTTKQIKLILIIKSHKSISIGILEKLTGMSKSNLKRELLTLEQQKLIIHFCYPNQKKYQYRLSPKHVIKQALQQEEQKQSKILHMHLEQTTEFLCC